MIGRQGKDEVVVVDTKILSFEGACCDETPGRALGLH
jgi:hypothetical protein